MEKAFLIGAGTGLLKNSFSWTWKESLLLIILPLAGVVGGGVPNTTVDVIVRIRDPEKKVA